VPVLEADGFFEAASACAGPVLSDLRTVVLAVRSRTIVSPCVGPGVSSISQPTAEFHEKPGDPKEQCRADHDRRAEVRPNAGQAQQPEQSPNDANRLQRDA